MTGEQYEQSITVQPLHFWHSEASWFGRVSRRPKSSNGTSTERRTTGRSGISGCRNTSDLMWRRMDYNFSHDLKMENDLQLVFCFSNPWSLHGLCMVLLCVAMC
jgi:hypothetical protein